MVKYRIIRKETIGKGTEYYIQKKVLFIFWVCHNEFNGMGDVKFYPELEMAIRVIKSLQKVTKVKETIIWEDKV